MAESASWAMDAYRRLQEAAAGYAGLSDMARNEMAAEAEKERIRGTLRARIGSRLERQP